eukprot:COSAG02_NODE_20239_length_841_cov_2.105121_1_plen_72_part_00
MAACAADATAMLDDATFVARMLALCEAFKAYVMVCADRGWLCAPKKTVLTGDYFDEQGVPSTVARWRRGRQ